MNVVQMREHPDYHKAMDKIRNYSSGFTFTVRYDNIPRAKDNALRILCLDAWKAGLLEPIQTGVALSGEITDETFRRTGVRV